MTPGLPKRSRPDYRPRAVAIPRAFSASAMARGDAAPALCISQMIGRKLAAWRSALVSMVAAAALRASARFGAPSFTPRALARESASRVSPMPSYHRDRQRQLALQKPS